MKITQFIGAIKLLGYKPYLDDKENYYLTNRDDVRIHFDTDTKEVYPLKIHRGWGTYIPKDPKWMISYLKRTRTYSQKYGNR